MAWTLSPRADYGHIAKLVGDDTFGWENMEQVFKKGSAFLSRYASQSEGA